MTTNDQPTADDQPELSDDERLTVDKIAFLTGVANTLDALLERPDAQDFLEAFFQNKASLHMSRDSLHVELDIDHHRKIDVPTGHYL